MREGDSSLTGGRGAARRKVSISFKSPGNGQVCGQGCIGDTLGTEWDGSLASGSRGARISCAFASPMVVVF
jgi:hypothetical protein